MTTTNNVKHGYAYFGKQHNGVQGHHAEGSRPTLSQQHTHVHGMSLDDPPASWQQQRTTTFNANVLPSVTNQYHPNASVGHAGFGPGTSSSQQTPTNVETHKRMYPWANAQGEAVEHHLEDVIDRNRFFYSQP